MLACLSDVRQIQRKGAKLQNIQNDKEDEDDYHEDDGGDDDDYESYDYDDFYDEDSVCRSANVPIVRGNNCGAKRYFIEQTLPTKSP